MRAKHARTIGSWVAVVLWSGAAVAAVCPVPSAPHPTIQSAVDDQACTEIVLAAQVFFEEVSVSRDLDLHGAGSAATTIEGRVVVEGPNNQVQLGQMTIDAGAPSVAGCCEQALESRGGAEVRGSDLVVRNAGPVFVDGFESGDTARWSSSVP